MIRCTIAVDFDGTCVIHDYPNIGGDIGAVPVLKALIDNGHRIILWTMRSEDLLQGAVDWFVERGIPLFGVNENPDQKSWTDSPKAHANLYIDDHSVGCPLRKFPGGEIAVDWEKVATYLGMMGLLTEEQLSEIKRDNEIQ